MDTDLEWILRSILGQLADSVLEKALYEANVTDFPSLMSLGKDEIENLFYVPDDKKKAQDIPTGLASLLKAFKAYVKAQQAKGLFSEVKGLSKAAFDTFRVMEYDPDNPNPTATQATTSGGNLMGTWATPSALNDFKRGIKRDKSHYKELKDDKQWDRWQRATIDTARSHGCEEVFDPGYDPAFIYQEEEEIFDEKQKFMYSVF